MTSSRNTKYLSRKTESIYLAGGQDVVHTWLIERPQDSKQSPPGLHTTNPSTWP